MCGIFGYYSRSRQNLCEKALGRMGTSIRHRGPDDQGTHSGKGFALGNQRLSIIDLAGGHQPMFSDDRNIIVVQNGEIFNYVELAADLARTGNSCNTSSDTEVILRLYERDGISFLSKLNGMFSIAIYDARTDVLYLVRDRIGVKPLFLYDDGDKLLFASEIKSILASGSIGLKMNHEALHHYLSFNYVPPPFTVYENIEHLMPGCFLKISRDSVKVEKWWDLADVQPVYDRNENDWIDEFRSILDSAVRLRLRSDVPFGAFLSGGVDSSSIVALMARNSSDKIKTFCIGFNDPRFDESEYAEIAANRFGTEHIMERVDSDMLDLWPLATYHCDQPHGDVSFLPTLRVSKLAAEHVKVVLTGDGGDELFAGYDKYLELFNTTGIDDIDQISFQKKYFQKISLFSENDKYKLYKGEMLREVRGCESYDVISPHFKNVLHQDRINQVLYVEMQLLLSGNNLVKPDRMGMAVSLEARTPFLDYRMMEFAFKMPGKFKIRNGQTKSIYKKAVEGLIGRDLAYRKKQMFTVPIGEWFKTSRKRYLETALPLDLFNADNVQSMCLKHLAGTVNYTRELRALIAVQHWDKVRLGFEPNI